MDSTTSDSSIVSCNVSNGGKPGDEETGNLADAEAACCLCWISIFHAGWAISKRRFFSMSDWNCTLLHHVGSLGGGHLLGYCTRQHGTFCRLLFLDHFLLEASSCCIGTGCWMHCCCHGMTGGMGNGAGNDNGCGC